MNKKIFLLICFFIIAIIPGETKAVTASVEEQIQAVIATAHAYYNQGEQLQYDSYRKNFYITPEDSTSKNYTYTVCSAFTFQTYYQALGIEIPDITQSLLKYAKNNKQNKDYIIFYYGSKDEIYSENVLGTKEKPNYSNFAKSMVQMAQPGDILVVTRTCDVDRICR